jgi:hypothetical protein
LLINHRLALVVQMRCLVLATIFLLAAPSPANGCFLDIFGICGGAEAIAQSLDNLPEIVSKAAKQVLDQLFKTDLPPFVDKITAAAEKLVDRGEKDYEKAVNATRDALTQLAKNVVKDCEELAKDVTKDVEEIVQLVMKDALETVQTIIADIDRDVNSLIDRLEKDGSKAFCAAEGYVDDFEKLFSSYFRSQDCECVQAMLKENPGLKQDCKCTSCFNIGGVYPLCTCNPWGLKFAEGWYNKGKYQFAKCHLQKPIDWQKWTVAQIESQLSIIQKMALTFRCIEDIEGGQSLNRDFFSDEFTQVSHTLLVLRNAAADSHKKLASTPASTPVYQHAHAIAKAQSGPGGPCEKKTLSECVIQALAELNTAQHDFEQEKKEFEQAQKNLTATISKNSADLAVFKGTTQQKFEHDEQDVAAKISDNSDLITGLQSKVDSIHSVQSSCRDDTTGMNDDGGDQGRLGYLDRHYVRCGSDEFLTYWHLQRSIHHSTIEIQYTCCKSVISMSGSDDAVIV